MAYRLVFLALGAFWVVMNVLLWRAEFGSHGKTGGSVPVAVVWQKILTAPDDSGLAILRDGKRVGFARWAPNVGDEVAAGKLSTEELPPEGMVKRLTEYHLELSGDVMLGTPPARLHFAAAGAFGTNLAWTETSARLAMRPLAWQLRARKAAEQIELRYDEETNTVWQRSVSFSELRNPQKLAEDLGAPALLALAGPVSLLGTASATSAGPVSLGLVWEASHDTLRIGRTQVQVYRLRARLVDKHEVVVIISRVGEILRVELPGGVTLVNEAIESL